MRSHAGIELAIADEMKGRFVPGAPALAKPYTVKSCAITCRQIFKSIGCRPTDRWTKGCHFKIRPPLDPLCARQTDVWRARKLLDENIAFRGWRTQLTMGRCRSKYERKISMKVVLCLLGIAIAITAIGTPVHAQGRRRCAFYGGHFGGATNCGFDTFEQCLATISGVGGSCQPNTMYVPPSGRHLYYRLIRTEAARRFRTVRRRDRRAV